MKQKLEDLGIILIPHIFEEVTSTNEVAKELLLTNGVQDLIVVAETQTQGMGRYNRTWYSPRGGLYFSIAFETEIDSEVLPALSLIASTSIVSVIRHMFSVPISIKWPNDLIVDDLKVGGILSELVSTEHNHVIIGIGLNIHNTIDDFPESLRSSSTTLRSHTSAELSLESILVQFLCTFYERLNSLTESRSLKPHLDEWREFSTTLGRVVRIHDGTREIVGTAIDVDTTGSLILETSDDERLVFQVGDVQYLRY